jgi:hypothetical protein
MRTVTDVLQPLTSINADDDNAVTRSPAVTSCPLGDACLYCLGLHRLDHVGVLVLGLPGAAPSQPNVDRPEIGPSARWGEKSLTTNRACLYADLNAFVESSQPACQSIPTAGHWPHRPDPILAPDKEDSWPAEPLNARLAETRNTPYWDCPDWPTCPRFPCKVWREGYLAGYEAGKADGAAEAYVAGYQAGFQAGMAAATDA